MALHREDDPHDDLIYDPTRHTCRYPVWHNEVKACRRCWYAVLRIIAREKGIKNYKKMRWCDLPDEDIKKYTKWVFV